MSFQTTKPAHLSIHHCLLWNLHQTVSLVAKILIAKKWIRKQEGPLCSILIFTCYHNFTHMYIYRGIGFIRILSKERTAKTQVPRDFKRKRACVRMPVNLHLLLTAMSHLSEHHQIIPSSWHSWSVGNYLYPLTPLFFHKCWWPYV